MTASSMRPADFVAPVSHEQVLHCLAGSFATEAEALDIWHRLHVKPGLHSRQVVLLGPAQSGWLPFRRQARAWAPGPSDKHPAWAADAPLMALLCAFGLSLVVAIGLLVEIGSRRGIDVVIDSEAGVLLCLLTPFAGAGLGWLASTWLLSAPQGRRFNSKVRGELTAGRWVVLMHGVPRLQQGSAFDLIRRHALCWCVVLASQSVH